MKSLYSTIGKWVTYFRQIGLHKGTSNRIWFGIIFICQFFCQRTLNVPTYLKSSHYLNNHLRSHDLSWINFKWVFLWVCKSHFLHRILLAHFIRAQCITIGTVDILFDFFGFNQTDLSEWNAIGFTAVKQEVFDTSPFKVNEYSQHNT